MLLRPTNFFLLVIAAASSASLAWLRAAQLGPGAQVLQAQPSVAQNSSAYLLEGVVINSVTGEPIRNALVQVSIMGARRSLLTGPEGKFHFENVPQGKFGINVQKPGFFSERELTHVFGTVEAGPNTAPVVLKLVPEGVIYGRITDAKGEPVEETSVNALYAEIVDGQRSMRQQFGAQTSSEGEFRIFELRPGTYYLNAGRFTSTFYPGVRDIDSAAPIRVVPGQQIRVDLQLQPSAFYQLSGMVVGAPPGAIVNVEFATSNSGGGSSYGFPLNNNDRSFTRAVAAGSYLVRASARMNNDELAASVFLNVSSDIAGLRLILAPTATIPVKVDSEFTRDANPAFPDALRRVDVSLSSRDSHFKNRTYSSADFRIGAPTEQPGLTVRNVEPGTYGVVVTPLGPWYVAAARRGNTDLLTQDLVVDAGGKGEPIEITLRDDFASVRGTVSSDGQPAAGSVLLIPEREQQPAITLPVDAAGHFQMDSVPPGEYTAFAFDRTADLEYRNPEAMREYVIGGQAVRLLAGGEGSLNLQLQKRREY
jgi:hypothetical protein